MKPSWVVAASVLWLGVLIAVGMAVSLETVVLASAVTVAFLAGFAVCGVLAVVAFFWAAFTDDTHAALGYDAHREMYERKGNSCRQ